MSAQLAVEPYVVWSPPELVSEDLVERYVRVILDEVFPKGRGVDWGAVTKNGLAYDLGPYPRNSNPISDEVAAILRKRFIAGR